MIYVPFTFSLSETGLYAKFPTTIYGATVHHETCSFLLTFCCVFPCAMSHKDIETNGETREPPMIESNAILSKVFEIHPLGSTNSTVRDVYANNSRPQLTKINIPNITCPFTNFLRLLTISCCLPQWEDV